MNPRLALYGGSFDPVHFGHLISARALAEHFGFSRVVLIPAARPPHKSDRPLAAAEHRLAMLRAAIDGDGLFEVSDIELHRPGPSFTIDTVTEFRARIDPDAELFWIIGADTLPELASWRRIADLLAAVRIIIAARPGWSVPDLSNLRAVVGSPAVDRLLADCCRTPQIDISSTDIRRRIAASGSVRYLLPDSVIGYVDRYKLYCDADQSDRKS